MVFFAPRQKQKSHVLSFQQRPLGSSTEDSGRAYLPVCS